MSGSGDAAHQDGVAQEDGPAQQSRLVARSPCSAAEVAMYNSLSVVMDEYQGRLLRYLGGVWSRTEGQLEKDVFSWTWLCDEKIKDYDLGRRFCGPGSLPSQRAIWLSDHLRRRYQPESLDGAFAFRGLTRGRNIRKRTWGDGDAAGRRTGHAGGAGDGRYTLIFREILTLRSKKK